jgi:SagB-type dehydrogenase family enzyme
MKSITKKLAFTIPFIAVISLLTVGCTSTQQNVASTVWAQKTPIDLTQFGTIALKQPNANGGAPLMQAMQDRISTRQFASENVTLEDLSGILWSAYGINREAGGRTVPSAFGIYPLKIYVVMANGIYQYQPEKNELTPIAQGDYRQYTGDDMSPYAATAPLNLLFYADFSKYKTGNAGLDTFLAGAGDRFVAVNTGTCIQDVYLYCASEGLKTVAHGTIDEAKMKELLQLDDQHKFVIAQTIGY